MRADENQDDEQIRKMPRIAMCISEQLGRKLDKDSLNTVLT